MKHCPNIITHLDDDQVFVFGSNNSGFHGAGSAGFAQRGTARNTWRSDAKFLAALKTPLGDLSRRGKWAELGVGRGFQQGSDGMSYAIATVTRPGARCSISLDEIHAQFMELGEFALERHELEFLMGVAGGGYNGWSVEDIRGVYRTWCAVCPPPSNIVMPEGYDFRKETL